MDVNYRVLAGIRQVLMQGTRIEMSVFDPIFSSSPQPRMANTRLSTCKIGLRCVKSEFVQWMTLRACVCACQGCATAMALAQLEAKRFKFTAGGYSAAVWLVFLLCQLNLVPGTKNICHCLGPLFELLRPQSEHRRLRLWRDRQVQISSYHGLYNLLARGTNTFSLHQSANFCIWS